MMAKLALPMKVGKRAERNDWDVRAVYSRLTERAWVRVRAATLPAEVQTSAR